MTRWYHGSYSTALLSLNNDTVLWERPADRDQLRECPGVYFTDKKSEAVGYGSFLISCVPKMGFRYMHNGPPTLRGLKQFIRENATSDDVDRFIADRSVSDLAEALLPLTHADTSLDALVQLYGGTGVIRSAAKWAEAMRRRRDGLVVKRDGSCHLIVWNLDAVRLKEIE